MEGGQSELFPSISVSREKGVVRGLRWARWVALGEDGSMFVTEANEKGVLELSAYGTPRRRIGGVEEEQRDVLKGAQGVAVAGDRLFVADSEAHLVAVYSLASGARVASLGKYGSASGELRHPVSVAATSRGKNLRIFVSERLNKRVQELTADGGHVRTYGSRTSPRSAATPPPEEEGAHIPGGSTFVGEPRGVATCARGHVYAVDAVAGKPGRVLVWDADGRAVRALGPAIAGNCRVLGEVDGAMLDPVGISIAPGSESVWVSHKLAISAVRSRPGGATGVEEPSSSASAAVCVVSCFCARSGAWRGVVAGDTTQRSLPKGPAPRWCGAFVADVSGGLAAGRGGAVVAATRTGLSLVPRGNAFPAHRLTWDLERILWAGALLGTDPAEAGGGKGKGGGGCHLARLPRDGERGCPLLSRIVRLACGAPL